MGWGVVRDEEVWVWIGYGIRKDMRGLGLDRRGGSSASQHSSIVFLTGTYHLFFMTLIDLDSELSATRRT